MKTILVVGGAGYIGSHMCKYLSRNGYEPVTLDNLITGHQKAVKWGPFYKGSLDDINLVSDIIVKYKICAVMHFAAHSLVGESVKNPALYYKNNVLSTLKLLEVMIKQNVLKFIFSSSAAVFGSPNKTPITETHALNPITPYGWSKMMVEQILNDFKGAYHLNSVSLRYFNAAGADTEAELGEDHSHETHLIPLVLKTALGQQKDIKVFGDDYPTTDGTCIRDYVHVEDLAQAHLQALQQLLDGFEGDVYNLGNDKGYSVKEVIETARQITDQPIPAVITQRRAGDPAILVSSSKKAKKELGFKPSISNLEQIIQTAWQWHKDHPDGFGD